MSSSVILFTCSSGLRYQSLAGLDPRVEGGFVCIMFVRRRFVGPALQPGMTYGTPLTCTLDNISLLCTNSSGGDPCMHAGL